MEPTFLLCEWVTPIWFAINMPYVPTTLNVTSLSKWLLSMLCPDDLTKKLEDSQIVWIFMTLWGIWLGRNAFVFESTKPSPMGVVASVSSNVAELNLDTSVKPLVSPSLLGVAPMLCGLPPGVTYSKSTQMVVL